MSSNSEHTALWRTMAALETRVLQAELADGTVVTAGPHCPASEGAWEVCRWTPGPEPEVFETRGLAARRLVELSCAALAARAAARQR